jgi:PAS domain S-box-containing protein
MKSLAGSLTRKTLLHVAIGVTAVISISSVLTYALMFQELQQRARERLKEYVRARGEAESGHLVLARDLQHVARRAVISAYPRYLNDPNVVERFDALFTSYPDGSVRSRPELFTGGDAVTGWVRRGTLLTEELRRRIVLFYDILEQFKPSSLIRFADIYVELPEYVSIGTDPPGWPFWSQAVAADAEHPTPYWQYRSSVAGNPKRELMWGSIGSPDSVWNKVLFTMGTPIDVKGIHIGTIYNELLFDKLAESLLRGGLPGTKQCVFQSSGQLIAHTDRMRDIIASQGQLTLQTSGDASLRALLRGVEDRPVLPFSSYDTESDHYFAISNIDGPGWYFAATISGEFMRGQAFRAARWVLWAGLASLAVLVTILAHILRRQIAMPLGRLNLAVERIGAGETGVVFSEHPHDEIGRLAGAFNDMAQKVAERDAALRLEKHGLEAALATVRDTEERWRALTEHASDVIVVLDACLAAQYVSPAIQSLLGCSARQLLGLPLWARAHPEDQPELERQLHETRHTSPGQRHGAFRYRARHEDGNYRHLEGVSGNLLGNPAVNGIVVNLRDITDQVRVDAELQVQREALYQRERLAAMGSLLAGVAHELNNPLAVVVGRSIMLEEVATEPRVRSGVQKIRIAADRCARIVKTFLAMARERGQNKTSVKVEEIIEAALDVVDYSLRTTDIEVTRDFAPDLPELYADADQLHQVFMNLFVNAQQAMAAAPGPRRLRIEASTRTDRLSVTVVVSDSGPGIPAEFRARIFDPYFTTKPMGKGTGVGLSISQGIVDAHRGMLLEQSEPGAGARFVLTLPVAGADALQSPPRPIAQYTAPDLEQRRVLVVDDDEDVRETLAEILMRTEHEVDLCPSGSAAAAQLEISDYDVIISDLRMQDGDGPALYRELLAHWPHLVERLVFVSGDDLSADLRRFLAEVRRPLIAKPFTPATVRLAMAQVRRAEVAPGLVKS